MGMQAGSVIVDLAAERGGNCELSQADETIVAHGVTILGPTNLPGEVPYHASQMFSKNVSTFLLNMMKDGQLDIDLDDEIVSGTLTRPSKVRTSRSSSKFARYSACLPWKSHELHTTMLPTKHPDQAETPHRGWSRRVVVGANMKRGE